MGNKKERKAEEEKDARVGICGGCKEGECNHKKEAEEKEAKEEEKKKED